MTVESKAPKGPDEEGNTVGITQQVVGTLLKSPELSYSGTASSLGGALSDSPPAHQWPRASDTLLFSFFPSSQLPVLPPAGPRPHHLSR